MDGRQAYERGAGAPAEPELQDQHELTDHLLAALKRQGLATWGGRGSVEDAAAELWRRGWRLKE